MTATVKRPATTASLTPSSDAPPVEQDPAALAGRRQRTEAATFLIPLAALGAMYALTSLLLAYAIECTAGCARAGDGVAWAVSSHEELRARLTWGLAVLAAVMTTSAAIIGSGAVALASVSDGRRVALQRLAWVVAALVIVTIAVLTRSRSGPTFEFNAELLQPHVYDRTGAEYFVTVVELLGVGAILALALAMGAVLHRVAREPRNVVVVANGIRAVRGLVVLSAVALTAGALETAALHAWGAVVRAGSPTPADTIALPQTLGLMMGAHYSLLLIAVTGPTLFRLNYWGSRLVDANCAADETRKEYRVRHGLQIALPQTLASLGAMLLPLIVGGPVGQALGSVMKQ